MADNEFTEKTKAVSGYFSMFFLMLGITCIPLFIAHSQELLRQGLLLPIMYLLELSIIVPSY
ncbi:hypothetical protein PL78_18010 [Yersinia entomophaga]|uniref:Uncharacterized protein n=1 Tax=Yersinia entomophaga TaxID=935293 RepID=A0ABM6BQF9_YERET|nr:hypothetical protein PL78_18010 [Yersinia entomophaga]OWF85009.1 hypothetical protein B4914_18240 [Yersinia entomophaga]